MNLKFKKQALLDALEARRPWAVELDRKQTEAHKAAERQALLDFRKNLRAAWYDAKIKMRAALKWDYAELARRASPYRGSVVRFEVDMPVKPSCPKSVVQQLDQAIAAIKVDGTERYVITENGHYHRVHYLLTHNENDKPDVCQ